MRTSRIALTGFFWMTALAPCLAQPAVDRLEGQVRRAVEDQAAGGAATAQPAGGPGYLGVVADDRNEQGRGVRVLDVVAGGPAAQAGIQNGDLITSIDGRAIRKMSDMGQTLQSLAAGSKLEFQVNRRGQSQKLEVTLGRRPAPAERRFQQFGRIGDNKNNNEEVPRPRAGGGGLTAANPATGQALGVATHAITDDARRQFKLPNTNGALVVSVTVGSPADRAGIPLGAAIVAANGQPVNGPDDLAELIQRAKPGEQIDLTCIIRGQEVHKQVRLAAAAPAGAPNADNRPRPIDADPREQAIDRPIDRTTNRQPPAADESRVEALERRIQQLEDRLDRIEAALNQK